MLNLQSNQIAVIDKSIKFLRELVQLNVAHNQLSTLPVEVFQLKKLQNLDASHNEVRVVIGHVNEYPTMHYFGIPRHTHSMTAYKISTEYFWKFQ